MGSMTRSSTNVRPRRSLIGGCFSIFGVESRRWGFFDLRRSNIEGEWVLRSSALKVEDGGILRFSRFENRRIFHLRFSEPDTVELPIYNLGFSEPKIVETAIFIFNFRSRRSKKPRHSRMPWKTSPGRVSWEQRWLADPVSAIQMTWAPFLQRKASAVKSASPTSLSLSPIFDIRPRRMDRRSDGRQRGGCDFFENGGVLRRWGFFDLPNTENEEPLISHILGRRNEEPSSIFHLFDQKSEETPPAFVFFRILSLDNRKSHPQLF